jgi:hypothetical protein
MVGKSRNFMEGGEISGGETKINRKAFNNSGYSGNTSTY